MEPMKVKDLIDLLKTKNPEENVIEACVSIAEYFILSSHQHIGFEYKKEFTSFYDAIEEYITTLNKYVVKHGEKSNVDFFITRMGTDIYGESLCKVIFSMAMRKRIIISQYWGNATFKTLAERKYYTTTVKDLLFR